MKWLDYFRKRDKDKSPRIRESDFGRFCDAYKPVEKYVLWEESLRLYDEGKRFSAFQKFFEYLRNSGEHNVSHKAIHGIIRFELIQGSQKITGLIDAQSIDIQALLTINESYPSPLLLELLKENYNLKFCKFALGNNGELKLVANVPAKVTSPYKLYHVLREVALIADKKDDLIFGQYSFLEPNSKGLHVELSEPIKRIYVEYVQDVFRKVLAVVKGGRIDSEAYPSAARYLMLAAVYKVDFLILPQGYLMERLEKIDGLAFSGELNDPKVINQKILAIIEDILAVSEEDVKSELYRTDATFGFNSVIQSAQIRDTIYSELPTMDWYINEGHTEYAVAIVDFIVGYLLFNFKVPPPCKALFLLYYRVREEDFFKKMEFDVPFVKGKQLASDVKRAVAEILEKYQETFPYMEASVSSIEYESKPLFCKTYLEMVAEINFTSK